MPLLKAIIFFLLFGLLAFSANAVDQNEIEILQTGAFHENEVPKSIGKNWFALMVSKDRSEFRAVFPKIKTVYDPVGDEENNRSTYSGKFVDVGGAEPLLLVRMKGLRVGPVTQATIEDLGSSQAWGANQKIVLHNMEYLFQRKCKNRKAKNGLGQCTVTLIRNGVRQWIADTQEGDSDFTETIQILWAGDIDRDGKLDLIIEETSYNNSAVVLYLSSHAGKGTHVLPVATLSRQGC